MEAEKKSPEVASVHSEECLPPSRWQKHAARFTYFLKRWGVETNGIDPIPADQRTDPKMFQLFFVWFSANMNVLGLGVGSAGPASFGLGLKQTLIIILIVDVICCAVPSYFAVFGPKLGARSMVQARYSWGWYGAMIPSALNVFTMQGYLILNCIIAGQTLASVSEHLNVTLGIVIISVISLAVTFCGYKVIHWYEMTAWIPNVIAFIIMLGVGGKHFVNAPPTKPVTASSVITFATTTASSVISWATMTPDYGVYHDGSVSGLRIFIYTYIGFITASITAHFLGAIFAACAPGVPAWAAGFDNGSNVGGLIGGVFSPLGGFGKFLCVLLAISIPSSVAPTMYTFSSSFMTIGTYFAMVPRYIYIFVAEAILIPVAIIGATSFYETFVDVLSIIGYWSTVWTVIILTEHFIFRRNTWARYDMDAWDTARGLPWGAAAVLSFACSFAIIIPSMDQAWYKGPIAEAGTGDIGILAGSGVAFLLYLVLRALEIAFTGR